MSRRVTSKPTRRAHRRTAAVVPVIETQRASTSGQTSRLTGPGRSGLSSSTLPAARGGARGAAGPSRDRQRIARSSSLPLTEDTRLLSFWFLRTVFLQGIFACAEYQSQSEDLEISPANWVSFFDKHSPRMVAYKAKYGKYMATTWSAAFLLGYARKDLKRYQTEWFIEESILTYPFIGGDEFPGLSSPIVTPSELISGGFVNYHKFSIDFELSVSGLDQDELFPEEAIYISDLVEDVGLSSEFTVSRQALVFSTQARTLSLTTCSIDFEAVESENEDQTDDGQEEEDDDDDQEPEEEDADHDIDVEEDPSPIDNEVEFVGEAVEQPVRIRSSLLEYPTSPVPEACFLERIYIQSRRRASPVHDKDSGFPRLEGGRQNTSLFGYDSVLARGGGKSRAARTSNAAGTPYPETKGVRMIT
ncbi:hypothetical protein BT96DRAFT_1007469, partial [Gymnopus androsaceus JB14]